MSPAARRRGGDALAALAASALALTPFPAVAWAAFAAVVTTSGSSFAAYTVPPPTNLHCSGLSAPLNSKILWDAVAPPADQTVDYVVTAPGGAVTTTAVTSYSLPAVTLTSGQYAVQTQISSGWRSQPATITVGLGFLGLLYTCNVP